MTREWPDAAVGWARLDFPVRGRSPLQHVDIALLTEPPPASRPQRPAARAPTPRGAALGGPSVRRSGEVARRRSPRRGVPRLPKKSVGSSPPGSHSGRWITSGAARRACRTTEPHPGRGDRDRRLGGHSPPARPLPRARAHPGVVAVSLIGAQPAEVKLIWETRDKSRWSGPWWHLPATSRGSATSPTLHEGSHGRGSPVGVARGGAPRAPPGRRARQLRTAHEMFASMGRSVCGAWPSRAAGHGRGSPCAHPETRDPAHRSKAADRTARPRRALESRDRCAAVHQPAHGPVRHRQRVLEAGHQTRDASSRTRCRASTSPPRLHCATDWPPARRTGGGEQGSRAGGIPHERRARTFGGADRGAPRYSGLRGRPDGVYAIGRTLYPGIMRTSGVG